MIHGRGPEPQQAALQACWETFLGPDLVALADPRTMVDYVALWGYVPPYQDAADDGCVLAATGGNPDVAARQALQALSDAMRNSDHLPLVHTIIGWDLLSDLKDAAVEALWRQFARDTGNQFAIDTVNFFKDRPEIRAGAGKALMDAITSASDAGHQVIVLAHSFGTIVAYETLRQLDVQKVDTLVTFGSPLAWCYDVWEAAAAPLQGNARYPQPKAFPSLGLAHWINVFDPLDPVATAVLIAAVPHLAPGYLEQGAQSVIDCSIANPYAKDDDLGSHHDWRGYLSSVPVVETLKQFLA
ncbi:MAG: PGAP1-like alpha/beta domain-containing protein, partial [Dehalococcoidia bacterium]